MKNENNQQCDPCEQNFENNVDKMVNDVEGYTSSDHKARQKEVDGAFGNKAQGQNKENGQQYGGDKEQCQKTHTYGSTAQGQNSEKGQSYGTGTKMQGQDEQWKQNGRKEGQQQYGSDKNSGTAAQGQSSQWKQNTPSGEKPYGRNSGIGSASDKNYGSTTDRHEHSDKEGGDAYARKTKIEGR